MNNTIGNNEVKMKMLLEKGFSPTADTDVTIWGICTIKEFSYTKIINGIKLIISKQAINSVDENELKMILDEFKETE